MSKFKSKSKGSNGKEQDSESGSEPTKIGIVKREGSTAVKVNVQRYKGGPPMVDIRVWYKKKGDKKYLPSAKGLGLISLEECSKVRRMLKLAETELESQLEAYESEVDGEEEE